MRSFCFFSKIAVLSIFVLGVSGCGFNTNPGMNNAADNRQSMPTNELARPGINGDNVPKHEYMRSNAGGGYITPVPVAYSPQSGSNTGLCPCQNQGNTLVPKTTTPSQAIPTPSNAAVDSIEAKVVQLTNDQRRKNGLPDLQLDTTLTSMAQEKSNDMLNKNYFSHTSPTYGSPFDMMKLFGITYSHAGENLAKGQRSAEEVVQAWMNSTGHRANILNGNYTKIGVGHSSSQDYWTQEFIGK